MTPEMLRPKEAARRFGASQSTLAKWATEGRIGRSKVGKAVWYPASDIEDVIQGNRTQRVMVRLVAPSPAPAPDGDWQSDPFWAGA